jgi:protein-S-isoprenylcysteine O-methyltransferase Ste14
VTLGLSGLAYGYALFALGKSNTYCNVGGLVTYGIYRWTRNPQYATVIPVYLSLAVAADSGLTYILCAAMIAVYVLMALNEEPWLEAAYGDVYRRYRRRVPRFFNWRRARVLVGWILRGLLRHSSGRFPQQGVLR